MQSISFVNILLELKDFHVLALITIVWILSFAAAFMDKHYGNNMQNKVLRALVLENWFKKIKLMIFIIN